MLVWKYLWLSVFLPFITGSVFYQKLSTSHRYLFLFVLTGVVTEILIKYLNIFMGMKNNMPIGHLYISLSFIFIALFYLYELKGFINQKIISGIIILFLIFSIINVFFFQSYYDYPSITGAIRALILLVFSILLFSHIMIEGKIKHLSQSSLIWINTGVLIYFAGNLFYNILFNLILDHSTVFTFKILNFFRTVNLIFYILLAVGFWKSGTKPQEQ